ncbi:PRC-barrel domain-containing protein [Metabacillus sp. GX 13764]|uniref:PRC-barrel domain-containing protein n=1 Tax=Metabacillus kandeliae TaxID=2900151 RepID=UPI001E5F3EC6|nr:PRC-barrel domain-containing protein [Metabacillus kandeliae]MCD7032997.1 PRC-barrel domain-containing protein [Metabacillus kandeliae]
MRTYRQIKGLPVFELGTAAAIGSITDLSISQNSQVTGFLMDGKGFFQRDRFIPLEAVHSIGNDGVFVTSREALKPAALVKQNLFLETHKPLYNKAVYNSSGDKLGLLNDVYFSAELGTIEAYELTDGFFADLSEGKKRVHPSDGNFTVSKDAIVMNAITE